MNGTEVRTNEWTNEWTNIWTDEWKYENYIPLGINAGGIKICGKQTTTLEGNKNSKFFICKFEKGILTAAKFF